MGWTRRHDVRWNMKAGFRSGIGAPRFVRLHTAFLACILPAVAGLGWVDTASAGVKVEIGESVDLDFGIWGQAWYQHVDLEEGRDLNDFQVRRMYVYLNGHAAKYIGFFGQIAGDRIGQEGLDNPA